jgi:hypothetical protein
MDDTSFEAITWSAPEYTHKERSVDFFWTIGLITVIVFVLALWFHNYLFAVFILISGACLFLFTIRPPEEVIFTIESQGIHIGRDMYEWENIHGFTIKKRKRDEPYAKLLIKTSRYFLPVFTIPLPAELVDEAREALLKATTLIELDESPSMQFMEKMGF